MEIDGLKADKSQWVKPKANKIKLFKALGDIAINLKMQNFAFVPKEILDAFEAFKFEDTSGQKGWKLIARALADALLNLIIENTLLLDKKDIETADLDDQIEALLENEDLFLHFDFFKNPGKLPFIESAKPVLGSFLELFDFTKTEVQNLLTRFPSYFVVALANEWKKNPGYYSDLKNNIVTPFDDAAKHQIEWLQYSKWLIRETYKPVFSEHFGLHQIYIPLRAYYKKRKETKGEKVVSEERHTGKGEHSKIVVELHNELHAWIEKRDNQDAIRIIQGGPGIGKSSFLKMFAAELAEKGKRVLFVPLHRFDFKSDVEEALISFISYDKFLSGNPLNESELIILFDGLDELSMQGKLLADTASQFLREIEKKVANLNHTKLQLQVIISGREVIVQHNENEFKKEGQIITVLPYYIPDETIKNENFADKRALLKMDQRNLWWQKYGRLKGAKYEKLPDELSTEQLKEITAQPLLNYLVALSYERKKIDFTTTTNLNEVYEDLMQAVYDRSYSSAKTLQVVKCLNYDDFSRVLQEIGVATWHGNGRTATIAEIKQHFANANLQQLLDNFVQDAEKGVVSLLAAFYFRQAGQNNEGARTFEFTHKSFGEYLTAKRIVEKLLQIERNFCLNEKSYDEGWPLKQCLTEWINIFGPKPLDEQLLSFIACELELIKKDQPEKVKSAQDMVIKLINCVLVNGMPIETYIPRPDFNDEYTLDINAESALLIILNRLALETTIKSDIKWPNEYSFGEWFTKLCSQNKAENLVRDSCNFLMLNNSSLDFIDFHFSSFRFSELNGSSLNFTALFNASLSNADLREASLRGADFRVANLSRANLSGANLSGANLRGADLSGANLSGVDLSGADLRGADLSGAYLRGVDLSRADLRGANLRDADLSGAKLSRTYFEDAILINTDLRGVDLSVANFEGVELSKALIGDLPEPEPIEPE
ncbi:MAG: pentapeptide repeat-containing protein [Ignavibacteriales bacterium]|nr:pentapeptide repeat-containing protein [Ignavibacteriales bacterium]